MGSNPDQAFDDWGNRYFWNRANLFFSGLLFGVTGKFIYGFGAAVLGLGFVAAILTHVTLDILKRLEFKEL